MRDRGRVVGAALVVVVAALPALLSGVRSANYIEHMIASAMLLGLYAMAWDFLNGYVALVALGDNANFTNVQPIMQISERAPPPG